MFRAECWIRLLSLLALVACTSIPTTTSQTQDPVRTSSDADALQQRAIKRIEFCALQLRKTGDLQSVQNEFRQAEEELSRSYQEFLKSQNLAAAALSLHKLGDVQRLQHRWQPAQQIYEQAYDRARRANHVGYQVKTLIGQARVAYNGLKDYKAATTYLDLVLVGIIYLPYRLLPAGTRESVRRKLLVFSDWSATPSSLAISGIALSVFLIQFVMRQCFQFNNLLLASELPEPGWMQRLLLGGGDGARSLYFSTLVFGIIITTCLVLAARSRVEQTSRSRFLISLLRLLVVIQFLFLPVNYGMLIVDKTLPKVLDLGGVEQLREGQEAWLVWEGKEGMTYLVRSSDPSGTNRKLVTLPLKEVKRTEIIRYDPILRCVFVGRCGE